MSYTLTIGNGVRRRKDDPPSRWRVPVLQRPDAPMFVNDLDTGQSNQRRPAYGTFQQFCTNLGFFDLFCDARTGTLRGGHLGCLPITRADADRVSEALARYQATAMYPPGFEAHGRLEGAPRVDGDLARAIWLSFWMQWAVQHCQNPAIQKS
jgi:hypothetical protein